MTTDNDPNDPITQRFARTARRPYTPLGIEHYRRPRKTALRLILIVAIVLYGFAYVALCWRYV